MERLKPHDITMLFLLIGALILVARIFGEIARKLNQPAVIGEILAGIILGPTVLGSIFPSLRMYFFAPGSNIGTVFDGIVVLGIALFLLVAGMEVDLSTVFKYGRSSIYISLMGIILPFATGFAVAMAAPEILGCGTGVKPVIFALFIGTAFSISALPVIAKTLKDMNIYRSLLGMLVITPAVLDDLLGWIIFSSLQGSMTHHTTGANIGRTILLTLLFAFTVLTVGKWLIHAVLPWLQAHVSWPGGVLSFALSFSLFCGALTEWIGLHAIFGAFIGGVAIGDSSHLREKTRHILDQFISFIFAPLFFVSIGLKVNFIANFNLVLVLITLFVASAGKLAGCYLGARWSGLAKKEALAIGAGMNARGAMEIILGLIALQNGIITEQLFVALVIMAMTTSLVSGPLMQRIMKRSRQRELRDYLSPALFVNPLKAGMCREVIEELAQAAGPVVNVDPEEIGIPVMKREELMHTGIGNGVAIPHGRIKGLTSTRIVVGVSREGIEFDCPDGQLVTIVMMIISPEEDYGEQIEAISEIGRVFKNPSIAERVHHAKSFTEFLALIKTERGD